MSEHMRNRHCKQFINYPEPLQGKPLGDTNCQEFLKAIYILSESVLYPGQQWSGRLERLTVVGQRQKPIALWPALGGLHLIPDIARSCDFTFLGSHQVSKEKFRAAYLRRERTKGRGWAEGKTRQERLACHLDSRASAVWTALPRVFKV